MYLDANKNGLLDPSEIVATTTSAGVFSFTGLQTGTYTVRQVLTNSWRQTVPAANAAITITITSGLVAAGENFGQTPTTTSTGGAITGTVFADTNGNGYKDSSESGIPGVTVFLDTNGDGAAESNEPSTITDINGAFSFTLLGPGTYRVVEVVPSGYTLTSPTTNLDTATVSAGFNTSAGAFADEPSLSTVRLSGTITGTPGSGTYVPANAFDGNLSTFYDGAAAGTALSPEWVGLDLGSPYVITSLGYASRSGYASRMNGGIFQASNTATFTSGVVTLYTIGAAENPSSTAVTTRQVGVLGAYRYVRYVGVAGSYGDCSEIRFYGAPVAALTVATGQTSQVTYTAATSRSHPYSSVAVGANATLVIAPAINRQAVQIYGSSSLLTGTTSAWTSTLNLNNNDLDLVGASLSTISNQIQQGYANGTWAGKGGILSSTAASDTTHLTAIGVITNSVAGGAALYNTFDSLSAAATDELVRTTYYGDANLDGKVDGSDYSLIDNGFIQHLTGWFNGDFNYDGVINGSDYTLIDNAFNTQGAAIPLTMVASQAKSVENLLVNGSRSRSAFLPANLPEQTAGSLLENGEVQDPSNILDDLDTGIRKKRLPKAELFGVA